MVPLVLLVEAEGDKADDPVGTGERGVVHTDRVVEVERRERGEGDERPGALRATRLGK